MLLILSSQSLALLHLRKRKRVLILASTMSNFS